MDIDDIVFPMPKPSLWQEPISPFPKFGPVIYFIMANKGKPSKYNRKALWVL